MAELTVDKIQMPSPGLAFPQEQMRSVPLFSWNVEKQAGKVVVSTLQQKYGESLASLMNDLPMYREVNSKILPKNVSSAITARRDYFKQQLEQAKKSEGKKRDNIAQFELEVNKAENALDVLNGKRSNTQSLREVITAMVREMQILSTLRDDSVEKQEIARQTANRVVAFGNSFKFGKNN